MCPCGEKPKSILFIAHFLLLSPSWKGEKENLGEKENYGTF